MKIRKSFQWSKQQRSGGLWSSQKRKDNYRDTNRIFTYEKQGAKASAKKQVTDVRELEKRVGGERKIVIGGARRVKRIIGR